MISKISVTDLIDALKKVGEDRTFIKGKIMEEVLSIYSVGFSGNFVNLTMLYKKPWENAEKNVHEVVEILEGYAFSKEGFPNGDSTVYLTVEKNLINYGVRISSFFIKKVLSEENGVLIIGGDEDGALRRERPPSPYLLKMQKNEPSNPFYFPFRPGIDKR
jgi:hypothetical protein